MFEVMCDDSYVERSVPTSNIKPQTTLVLFEFIRIVPRHMQVKCNCIISCNTYRDVISIIVQYQVSTLITKIDWPVIICPEFYGTCIEIGCDGPCLCCCIVCHILVAVPTCN